MNKHHRFHRVAALSAALLLAGAGPSYATAQQGDAQAEKPAPALTVRDLVVLQTDRYGDVANNPIEVQSTLFQGVIHTGRRKLRSRQGMYDNTPMPLGLITFEGRIDQPMRVRLDLPDKAKKTKHPGFFHAHWPNDAQKGKRSIDWFQVREAGESQQPEPADLDEHWLKPLRESQDRLWLKTRDPVRKERFFLYDAAFAFKPTATLNKADAGYRIEAIGETKSAPLLVFALQQSKEGWTRIHPNTPWADNAPALPSKTVKPALAPLADLLTERGYNEVETRIALGMVASAGLDRSSMSLVYVLPDGVIDEHIWLRFKPEPDRLIRTAIVVLNNVDPALGQRLDRLIAELGSEDWQTRDRAQQKLETIGLAAIKKVQAAKNSPDPEVAFRAQQILDAYDYKQQLMTNP